MEVLASAGKAYGYMPPPPPDWKERAVALSFVT
jgi:hypothetical protein